MVATNVAHLGTSPSERPVRTQGVAIADPAGALTDSSGGTASDTLAAITGSYVEATIENTVASLAAKIESNRATLALILAELRAQDSIAT